MKRFIWQQQKPGSTGGQATEVVRAYVEWLEPTDTGNYMAVYFSLPHNVEAQCAPVFHQLLPNAIETMVYANGIGTRYEYNQASE